MQVSRLSGVQCVDVGFVLSPHTLALGGGSTRTREGPPGVHIDPAPLFSGPRASVVYPGDAFMTEGARPLRRGPAVFCGRPCPGVYCLISSESAHPFRGCQDLEQHSRPAPTHVPPAREGHAEAGAQASHRGALWDSGWESKMRVCHWPLPLASAGVQGPSPVPGSLHPSSGSGLWIRAEQSSGTDHAAGQHG